MGKVRRLENTDNLKNLVKEIMALLETAGNKTMMKRQAHDGKFAVFWWNKGIA